MKLPLSKRLLRCCEYVKPGDRVADIGCDHGYLGIHLLTNGIAKSVIASDVNEGPLHSAVIHAEKYGVREKISFYLSDGVRNVPRQFDCMVCAGMGADTIISILQSAPWLKSGDYRLILQCQSKTPALRKFLSESGWYIQQESIIRDGRFLYTVMEVIWKPDHPLSPGQCYLSPALLALSQAELPEYYARLSEGLRLAVNGRGKNAVPYMAEALKELEALTQDPAYQWLKEDPHDNR